VKTTESGQQSIVNVAALLPHLAAKEEIEIHAASAS